MDTLNCSYAGDRSEAGTHRFQAHAGVTSFLDAGPCAPWVFSLSGTEAYPDAVAGLRRVGTSSSGEAVGDPVVEPTYRHPGTRHRPSADTPRQRQSGTFKGNAACRCSGLDEHLPSTRAAFCGSSN